MATLGKANHYIPNLTNHLTIKEKIIAAAINHDNVYYLACRLSYNFKASLP